jgi:hypothetical protein
VISRRTLPGLGCGNRPRDADRRTVTARTHALIACVPPATTAGVAALAMVTAPERELAVTPATDSGRQAGCPYFRDSSEKDHAMVSRAGSDGAVYWRSG